MGVWQWSLAMVACSLFAAAGIWYAVKVAFASNRKKYGFDSQDDGEPINEIKARIEREDAWARAQQNRLGAWLQQLKNPKYEVFTPDQILANAESSELRTMQEITGEIASEPAVLIKRLRSIGSNSLAQAFRWLTRSDGDEVSVPYHELVQDACKSLGARCRHGPDIFQSELMLQREAFSKVLRSMPECEQERLLKELSSRTAAPSLGKEAVVGGGLVIANLSGFGLYLASSTALGALTSAIGVALPFAVYTGMSSTLAVIIGPVGWVALGTWVVHKLGRPDPNKVIAGTLLIANIRQRLIAIRDEPIPYIVHDRDIVLASFRRELVSLQLKLKSAERYGLSHTDPVDSKRYAPPTRPALTSDAKRARETGTKLTFSATATSRLDRDPTPPIGTFFEDMMLASR